MKRIEERMSIAKVHYLHAQKCHNEHLYLVCLVYANKNSLSLLTRFSREQPEWGVVLFLGRCGNPGCFHYLTWIWAIVFLASKCHVWDGFFFFIWGLSTLASWLSVGMFYTIRQMFGQLSNGASPRIPVSGIWQCDHCLKLQEKILAKHERIL